MSSFKKFNKSRSCSSEQSVENAGPAKEQQFQPKKAEGVKPWINCGLGLVSSGNKQLDDTIGGGFALGTCTLLSSDRHSNFADTLLLYSLVEGICVGHDCVLLLPSRDLVQSWLSKLPLNLSITEDSGRDPMDAPSFESSVSRYCCSYDLSRSLQPWVSRRNPPRIVAVSDCRFSQPEMRPSLQEALQYYLDSVQAVLLPCPASDPDSSTNSNSVASSSSGSIPGGSRCEVCRIFLPMLCETIFHYGGAHLAAEVDMAVRKFFLSMKQCTLGKKVQLLVSVRSSMISEKLYQSLVVIADSVIGVESFAGRVAEIPAEFNEFQAFLQITKLQQLGSIAPWRPSGTRFGLKRDRRKLHVEPLHLPPELSRATATDTSAALKAEDRLWRPASAVTSNTHHPVVPASTSQGLAVNDIITRTSPLPGLSRIQIAEDKIKEESHTVTHSNDEPDAAMESSVDRMNSLAKKFASRASSAGAKTSNFSLSTAMNKKVPGAVPLQPGSLCNSRTPDAKQQLVDLEF